MALFRAFPAAVSSEIIVRNQGMHYNHIRAGAWVMVPGPQRNEDYPCSKLENGNNEVSHAYVCSTGSNGLKKLQRRSNSVGNGIHGGYHPDDSDTG